MAKRTPPCPEYEAWTTARYWQFVRSALRKAWMKWPPKFHVMKAAVKEVKGKRHRFEYKCAKCKHYYPAKEVAVDHITPAGSLNDWKDLVPFVQKLFVSAEKLQVLCKKCHTTKTMEERDGRAM